VEADFTAVLARLYGDDAARQTVLAVSGGVDSVVMAQLFKTAGRPFIIAHCNFQLRGDDSLADERFVQALGKELGVPVLVKRFSTENYAGNQGVSLQMAARDLRYAWFKELAATYEAWVAIAHHANDVVETMLFNLAKGTGLAGLHGLAEKDGVFIRPLLWAGKATLLAYAEEKGLTWREDVSNTAEKYMRNLVRRQIVPEMERINPAFVAAGLRTARRIAAAEAFVAHAIGQLGLVEERPPHIYLAGAKLADLPGREAVLYHLLSPYGYNYAQVSAILASLGRSGAVFVAGNWQLNIDRDYLILSRRQVERPSATIAKGDKLVEAGNKELRIEVHEAAGYTMPTEAWVAGLDLAKLSFPLHLRPWQQGDYFVPLGMTGKKKLSDFLIDEKVPVNLKQEVLVLLAGKDIVWVVGYRIDDRYKITGDTQKVWQVSVVNRPGRG